MSIILTDAAAEEVKAVMAAREPGTNAFLRMSILGGGCSGLQYSLSFDTEYDPKTDAKYEQHGVFVVTKKKFDLHLEGTEVDFLDTPTARGFSIENPNYPKGAGCAGCGG